MKTKWILNFSALVLVGIFTAFVVGVDRYAENNARANMENHALVVSDDLWNFNVRGITDYLTLAADSYGYRNLVVTDFKGQLFWNHQDRKLGWITEKLIRLNLITQKRLIAPVMYGDMLIGAVEADWLNKTLFLKAYLFFALILIYVVIFLYTRIVVKKQTLEENVRIRTHELLDANQSLKQEIEERKRMEEALRESEKKHRFLAENINDVIWTMDLSMKYTYVSPVSCKLHGWSEEELEHLTIADTLTPESLETAKHVLGEQLRLAEETGDYNRSVTLILETNSKDGSTLWCEIIAKCIVDENKRPLCIMGVTRNITERMRTQRERDMLQKQLERSKKMESLGILAGGVAHDLNNVLSGIVSYPELLLLDLPPESSLYAPIRVIRDSGLKAAAIVEDLLTLARRGVTAHETISLNHVVREYLESPEHEKIISYHKKTQVTVHLENDLPNIQGSKLHIKKSLMNLVSNAVESQVQGGVVRIATQSRYLDEPLKGHYAVSEGEYVVLSVADQGEGISENDLQRIFEPFYTKKVMGRSGTGLGLAVVWGTVQDHKGYINVSSRLGRGTEFELYFPMVRGLVADEEQSVTLESIMGSEETVLVVDDIREQRDIATRILSRLNYQVHSVSTGEEAVAYLKTHRADMVLLDMIMGSGMDGLDTYRAIIGQNPSQKTIIVSGYSETDRVKEAEALGVLGYVKKPYMLESIGRAVKKAMIG